MLICMQHQLGCSADQHLNIEKQHSFFSLFFFCWECELLSVQPCRFAL